MAAGAVTGAVALPGVHNAVFSTTRIAVAVASPAAPASTVAVNLVVARSSCCPLRSDTGYIAAFMPCESLCQPDHELIANQSISARELSSPDPAPCHP